MQRGARMAQDPVPRTERHRCTRCRMMRIGVWAIREYRYNGIVLRRDEGIDWFCRRCAGLR